MLAIWIIGIIFAAVVIWLLFWRLVTTLVTAGSRQKQFAAGKRPSQPPDGFYRGNAILLSGANTPWKGKYFEAESDRGFNVFSASGTRLLRIMTPFYRGFRSNGTGGTDAYYFATRIGSGLRDKGIEVVKLDYDSKDNPYLIRIILDEIVETGPEEYLGKVHVRIFPGVFTTVGFFALDKMT
ncbi:MAG: hypothetical protein ABI539_12875 [Acidobacteriota bacterium]